MQIRAADLAPSSYSEADNTVEVVWSTGAPVRRYDWESGRYYDEVLSMDPSAVRLGRLNGGASFLDSHGKYSLSSVIGSVVPGTARIEDGTGLARIKLSSAPRDADTIVKIREGVIRSVSVGYVCHRIEKIVSDPNANQTDQWRVTDWEPYEISAVPVNADAGAVVRAQGAEAFPCEIETINERGENEQMANQSRHVDVQDAWDNSGEKSRIEQIKGIADLMRSLDPDIDQRASSAVYEGISVADFRAGCLRAARERSEATIKTSPMLTAKEDAKFSVTNAIRAMMNGQWNDNRYRSFEKDVTEELVKRGYKSANGGALIPHDLIIPPNERTRTLTTTDAGGAAELNFTMPMPFIERLRNQAMVMRLGATMLSGLEGKASFPRQIGQAAASWVSENPGSDVSETQFTLDDVELDAKTLMAATSHTKQTLNQLSYDIEELIRNDLMAVNALAIDLAALAGTGTAGQPTGILNTSGVNLVAIGANGGAPTWTHIVGMETAISEDNAETETMAYLTTPGVRGKLKTTLDFEAAAAGMRIWQNGNIVNGYRAEATNQMPKGLTKGTSNDCHSILFGSWPWLMIGMWGAFEIVVNPFAELKKAKVQIVTFQQADIALRYPEAFSAIKDARV